MHDNKTTSSGDEQSSSSGFSSTYPMASGKYIQKKISSEQHEGIQISVKHPNIVQP